MITLSNDYIEFNVTRKVNSNELEIEALTRSDLSYLKPGDKVQINHTLFGIDSEFSLKEKPKKELSKDGIKFKFNALKRE